MWGGGTCLRFNAIATTLHLDSLQSETEMMSAPVYIRAPLGSSSQKLSQGKYNLFTFCARPHIFLFKLVIPNPDLLFRTF